MASTEPASDGVYTGREAVAAVLAAWNAAGSSWNPRALTEVYTDDALFHGGRPEHHVGQVAIRGYFDSYLGVIASASLDLVDQHIVVLAPGTILAQGFGDYSFVLAGDQATKSRLRTTLVIVQRDGWRILAHHFSPPPAVPPLGNT